MLCTSSSDASTAPGFDLHGDVEVAVAGVAEDAGIEAEPVDLGAGELCGAGELRQRHAHVRRPLLRAGKVVGRCVRCIVAGLPQPRAGVGVALVDDLGRALLLGDRLHELEVGVRRAPRFPPPRRRGTGLPGYDVPEYALAAATNQASRNSMRVTPAPAATIEAAVLQALSMSGNEMRSATACSGIAWSLTVTSVITASVPSEPTSSPVRS